MKSLYACIEINRKMNKVGNVVTERVKYYKTKDEMYGIQIVKDNDLQNEEKKIKGKVNRVEREIISNMCWVDGR